jgi:hypothetical protein
MQTVNFPARLLRNFSTGDLPDTLARHCYHPGLPVVSENKGKLPASRLVWRKKAVASGTTCARQLAQVINRIILMIIVKYRALCGRCQVLPATLFTRHPYTRTVL